MYDLADGYGYPADLDSYMHYLVGFKLMANSLADAGGRALGAVISKYKSLKGLGYHTFTKLYSTCVCPVLDYASEIWGLQHFHKIDAVQQRAIRVFLGVHCYAPVLALNGDCGWKYSIVRRKTQAVRFWNRLQLLDNNRLTKKIFLFEKHNELGWAAQMKEIFEDVGLLHAYENNETE
jgi:hypothetical protein